MFFSMPGRRRDRVVHAGANRSRRRFGQRVGRDLSLGQRRPRLVDSALAHDAGHDWFLRVSPCRGDGRGHLLNVRGGRRDAFDDHGVDPRIAKHQG